MMGKTMHGLKGMLLCLGILVAISPAQAAESTVQKTSSQSVEAVWVKIGDFCGIGSWQPGVAKCELSKGKKRRTLTLKSGAVVVEELLHRSNRRHSYTYRFVSGPLPVNNYQSTIQVTSRRHGRGSVVTWRGHYDAKGVSDAEAKKIIDGLYVSGLAALLANNR